MEKNICLKKNAYMCIADSLCCTTVWHNIVHQAWKVKVKVAKSCPTLCHPMDYTVHGILQARILE